MPARLLSKIAIAGAQVVVRAFIEAYRDTVLNAARNHAAAAAAANSGQRVFGRPELFVDEARKILHVKTNSPPEEILKRYELLFKANDQSSGGSLYLQSKVVRAKELLFAELKKEQVQPK